MQCRKRLRGSSVNQTPPPPLVHERRPRGSRRCTELELNVAAVHGTSRNPITERAVVHETRPLRGFANRTAGRVFRCAAAEEPTELNRWLSCNIQRSQSQLRKVRGDYRGGETPNSATRHFFNKPNPHRKAKRKVSAWCAAVCAALRLLLPFLVGRLGLGRA